MVGRVIRVLAPVGDHGHGEVPIGDEPDRPVLLDQLIRAAAPALDLLLFAGDRLSRVAGRNQIDPEPARRTMLAGPARTPIGGPPERTTG